MSRKTTTRPPKRKRIPDRVKLEAALARFGLTIDQVQFDHNPALELREWNPLTGDTIPPANDPGHIDMLTIAEHKTKTFGPGGEKRITTAGSDVNKIHKLRRLQQSQKDFQAAVLRKGDDEETKPKRRSSFPSRPFPKRTKSKK